MLDAWRTAMIQYTQQYTGAKDVDLYPSSEAAFRNGKNEKLFCHRVYELNYFYELKNRPVERVDSVNYYGYELKFWANYDPIKSRVQIASGLDTDPYLARENVFAAGLAKLANVKSQLVWTGKGLFGWALNPKETQKDEKAENEKSNCDSMQGCASLENRQIAKEKPLDALSILKLKATAKEPLGCSALANRQIAKEKLVEVSRSDKNEESSLSRSKVPLDALSILKAKATAKEPLGCAALANRQKVKEESVEVSRSDKNEESFLSRSKVPLDALSALKLKATAKGTVEQGSFQVCIERLPSLIDEQFHKHRRNSRTYLDFP